MVDERYAKHKTVAEENKTWFWSHIMCGPREETLEHPFLYGATHKSLLAI
jgi:hypothetical protein